ncbi:MAG: hypothetical protein ACI3W8_06775 [Oscillospiraceae bacterium]
MKRLMLTLLLTAVMAVSLAACGNNQSNAGLKDTTPYIDGVETPAERSGEQALEDGSDRIQRATDDVLQDAKENTPSSGSSNWEEMLRNGQVRDTDGDLKDGENALYGEYNWNR